MIPDPVPLAAFPAPRAAEWRPGAAGDQACLHGEIFAPAGEATGSALALALALDRLRGAAGTALVDTPDQRPWLWVQDKAAIRLSGRPYRPGLPRELRHRLLHVAAASPQDALFALEEGLRCRDLAFVIGEMAGNPRALSFTASRRLSLVAQRHGVPLWLVRLDARRDLGSARMRWQARAAPSRSPCWNPQAPGAPGWRAELFRAGHHPPGEWILRDEDGLTAGRVPPPGSPRAGDLVRGAGDRPLAAG